MYIAHAYMYMYTIFRCHLCNGPHLPPDMFHKGPTRHKGPSRFSPPLSESKHASPDSPPPIPPHRAPPGQQSRSAQSPTSSSGSGEARTTTEEEAESQAGSPMVTMLTDMGFIRTQIDVALER